MRQPRHKARLKCPRGASSQAAEQNQARRRPARAGQLRRGKGRAEKKPRQGSQPVSARRDGIDGKILQRRRLSETDSVCERSVFDVMRRKHSQLSIGWTAGW